MQEIWKIVLIAAAALAAGFIAAVLAGKPKLSAARREEQLCRAEKDSLSARLAEAQKRMEELSGTAARLDRELAVREAEMRIVRARVRGLEEENDNLFRGREEARAQLAEACARSAAVEQSNRHLQEWIEKAGGSLRDSFASLSKDIAENNARTFLENANDKLRDFALKLGADLKGNNAAVSGIVEPVGKELQELRGRMAGLTAQMEGLQKQNSQLQDATNFLSSTLKNNAQRGKWGEEQLHRIAELAGMVEHIDFEEQQQSADGSRPDMMIYLTGGRSVPVDSKAPMAAYMLYLDDTDEPGRSRHLAEHTKALRAHIDALAKKAYWKSGERSAEMVAMVVPYESGLSAAFACDREIFTYAMEKNVLLLSPMTFYAFLKAAAAGWQENAMSRNAKEIAFLSRELIDRFEVFFRYFSDIDKSIANARIQYDRAVSSYNSRLAPTFSRLKSLNTSGGEAALLEEAPEGPGEEPAASE
ncbi:MAG: DNA recombination protein RmuC [Oscillospiraceae bacterium]|nr:DNA recombination protein RmuC [Oscillospiraceae bacterium]